MKIPLGQSEEISRNDKVLLPADHNIVNINQIYKSYLETNSIWKKGTTLIVGDSMLYGIDEKRLCNTKVRIFPGSTIEDT